MWIEERLAVGHVKMSIVSSARGAILSETLREAGFAVTEIPARGKDGMVSMLSVSVRRRDVSKVETLSVRRMPKPSSSPRMSAPSVAASGVRKRIFVGHASCVTSG